ncbi:hypothetical protein E1176_04640, partial [Fulvivirga sp. RKSG066]|uniref:hypothetical protein n=1 Tax=Fulvivirga aurantia TaxID=2529383 RepID=UPI0012BCA4AD
MRHLIIIIICCSYQQLYAQVPAVNPFLIPDSLSEASHIRLPRLQGFSKYYWNQNWHIGNIYFDNGQCLKGYYIRYDILKNQLEIIVDNQYKYLIHNNIERFEWYNPQRLLACKFVNTSYYDFKKEPLTGFLEVIADGHMQLLKRRFVYALKKGTSPTLVN